MDALEDVIAVEGITTIKINSPNIEEFDRRKMG